MYISYQRKCHILKFNLQLILECGVPGRESLPSSSSTWSIAQPGSWTWQAYIAYKVGFFQMIRYGCMATLIGRRYLLTTAHCVSMANGALAPAQLLIYMGVTKRESYSRRRSYEVDKIIIHPYYKSKLKQQGDLALLRLKQPIVTTKTTIQPICLHQKQPITSGHKLDLITWGRVTEKRSANQIRFSFA